MGHCARKASGADQTWWKSQDREWCNTVDNPPRIRSTCNEEREEVERNSQGTGEIN